MVGVDFGLRLCLPPLKLVALTMRNPSWPGLLLLALALAVGSARAQEEPPWVMYAQTPEGHVSFNLTNNIFIGTNGVVVSNRNVVLTTDCAEGNNDTGEVEARGHVSIQGKGHQWEGTNAVYNFRTGEMRAGEFRTMQRPFYV